MGAIMFLYSVSTVQFLIKVVINSTPKNYWLTSVILNFFLIKQAVLYNVGLIRFVFIEDICSSQEVL